MNEVGSWYVLFRRERLVALSELAPRLASLRGARIEEIDAEYAEIVIADALTGNSAVIRIFVDTDANVLDESRQFVREHGERKDHDAIANADARYAIGWELPYSDETYNPRCIIAVALARATDGVVYDLMEDRVVWSAPLDAR